MNDYEKLKQIMDEIPILISANVTSSDPKLQAWHTKAERFLISKFGEDSYERECFAKTVFNLRAYAMGTPNSAFVAACRRGLEKTQAIFQTYLDDMDESCQSSNVALKNEDYSKVFIVHGHDGELKQSVARIIEKQGIEAIILSEKANCGKTIIEKFENYSQVSCAICLFTADDVGKAKSEPSEKPRARQNVVLETGFFMGSLGRDHIVILADEGIEIPSDLSGIVYSNTGNWQVELLRELKAIGYSVDFNKLF